MKIKRANIQKRLPQLRIEFQKNHGRHLSGLLKRLAGIGRRQSTKNGHDSELHHDSAKKRQFKSDPKSESYVLEQAGQATGIVIGSQRCYTFYAVFPALFVLEGQVFCSIEEAEQAVKKTLQELKRKGKPFCPICGYTRAPSNLSMG